jgi:hypothetical protein
MPIRNVHGGDEARQGFNKQVSTAKCGTVCTASFRVHWIILDVRCKWFKDSIPSVGLEDLLEDLTTGKISPALLLHPAIRSSLAERT